MQANLILSQMYVFIQLPITHKLFVKGFLAASFDAMLESSAGHHTEAVKIQNLYIVRMNISCRTSNDIW